MTVGNEARNCTTGTSSELKPGSSVSVNHAPCGFTSGIDMTRQKRASTIPGWIELTRLTHRALLQQD